MAEGAEEQTSIEATSGGAADQEEAKEESSSNSGAKNPPSEPQAAASARTASSKKMKSSTSTASSGASSSNHNFTYHPDKISLRFLFANRDGLTLTLDCDPADTVGEVKGALLSVWPDELKDCSGGDQLRLICMGKGVLTPDSRTLEDCQVPRFKTHATPVNVSVRPDDLNEHAMSSASSSPTKGSSNNNSGGGNRNSSGNAQTVDTGCACSIL